MSGDPFDQGSRRSVGLHWNTIGTLTGKRFKNGCRPSSIRATLLGVDEFAVKRGQHYETTVIDAATGQGSESARLEDLLAINSRLNVVYVLKEDLKRLWGLQEQGVSKEVVRRLVRQGHGLRNQASPSVHT